MTNPPTIVGIGEILWDLLPSGRQLGGAPANFAYCSHSLGNRAIVASCVGNDELGQEIRRSLNRTGLARDFLQTDSLHPTGTVRVHLDSAGQPQFEITQPVAWDFLESSDDWQRLAKSADAVCFGSLAQRSEQSRNTIRKFLDATREDALRIFDVNLRQNFYSAEVITESLNRANAVKLNNEEVPRIKDLLRMNADSEEAFAHSLIQQFKLTLACITRGANGSLLCGKNGSNEHPGFHVTVKDTVGAGDAFTAGLVHAFLQGQTFAEMNDLANRMGAWVASNSGAMPPIPSMGLKQVLAAIH
ncbi:MAG TPA: carbohydrate kinase [Terriglobales bacterium]|nr:carbohydrate kinase [Terriglobales bacterium]